MPDLGKLLNPASLVVIGASEDTKTNRGHTCEILLHYRWAGRVFFVSRSSEAVFGRPTYKQVDDLPEIPDLALLLTPAAGTVDALRACDAYNSGWLASHWDLGTIHFHRQVTDAILKRGHFV